MSELEKKGRCKKENSQNLYTIARGYSDIQIDVIVSTYDSNGVRSSPPSHFAPLSPLLLLSHFSLPLSSLPSVISISYKPVFMSRRSLNKPASHLLGEQRTIASTFMTTCSCWSKVKKNIIIAITTQMNANNFYNINTLMIRTVIIIVSVIALTNCLDYSSS